MGLKGSKTSAEARAVLLGFDTAGKSNLLHKLKESLFNVRAIEYIEMEKRPDAKQKKRKFNWMHCGQEASGLVYVMDDPTGGVWMKPKDRSTTSWKKNA